MAQLTILTGDCRQVLKTLPDASVHCCVTSPPYWGLRDYGTATWEGGDAACDHRKLSDAVIAKSDESRTCGANESSNHAATPYYRDVCGKCGARRIDAQLGMEESPQHYVSMLVSVFREVRRVLRDDGTVWLNLGDSYNGYMANQRGTGLETDRQHARKYIEPGFGLRSKGLKPKDLVGIPWRVAFALQEDGWYLRSDIIWHKPNPMPESVTDRPTKAHEYLFLLSKSEKYHYDNDAIREPHSNPEFIDAERYGTMGEHNVFSSAEGNRSMKYGTEWSPKERAYNPLGRNRRSVWTVPTSPYPEAHFATYPPDLIKPCIMAGCPVGGTVLDPFGGSGTTGMVALELGRSAILIELNPDYAQLAKDRCNVTYGLPL